MNSVLAKVQQDNINKCWQPFATSTPLKIVHDNKNNNNLKHKQLKKPADILNAILNHDSKTSAEMLQRQITQYKLESTKKKKKSRYLDLSSSESDDTNQNNLVDIKMHVENTFKSQKLKKKEIKLEEKKNVKKKIKSNKQILGNHIKVSKIKDISAHEKLKSKKQANFKSNNGTFPYSQELSLRMENFEDKRVFLNLDKGNNKENFINNVETVMGTEEKEIFENLGSSLNESTETNLKILGLNNCKRLRNNKLVFTTKNDKLKASYDNYQLNKKLVFRDLNNDFKNSTNSRKAKLQNYDTVDIVANKRKASKILNAFSPAKKIKKISNAKEINTELELSEKKIVSPSHIFHKNNNLSHQSFSANKKQELINSLNLTVEENKIQNSFHKEIKIKTPLKPIKLICKADFKNNVNESKKTERTSRQKKQLCFPENPLFELCFFDKKQNEMAPKIQPKNNSNNRVQLSRTKNKNKNESFAFNTGINKKVSDQTVKCIGINTNVKSADNQENQNSKKQNESNILKTQEDIKNKNKLDSPALKKKFLKNAVYNHKTKLITSVKSFEKKVNNTAGICNDEFKVSAHALDSTIPVVFKQLNQLSFFEENQHGCFTSECWSFKNFKSGVFKLSIKSQLASKTKYANSYLGGIVIKGNLRMKIGSKELGLKEGDMFLVPPLTEWFVMNESQSESSVYYWCTRIKS